MDVNTIRVGVTVLCFAAFIGIVFWAYSSKRKRGFDEAANLPFADDEMQEKTVNQERSNH